MFYRQKVGKDRTQHPAILAGKNIAKADETCNLVRTMERFAEIILSHTPTGVIPLKMTSNTPHVSATFRRNEQKQSTVSKTGQHCYFCGDKITDFRNHLGNCRGRSSSCETCGRVGHLTKVCSLYKRQRINLFRKRNPKKEVHAILNTIETNSNNGMLFATNVNNFHEMDAGIDSCSSVNVFHDLRWFETLDQKQKGQINLTTNQASYVATGIVKVKFKQNGQTYRFPALYVPDARLNILSNRSLHFAGIKPSHDPSDPKLVLQNGEVIPLAIKQGITVVKLQPPTKPVSASTLLSRETPSLWHARAMHTGKQHLVKAGLIKANTTLEQCSTCLSTKPKFMQIKTIKDKKYVPKQKLDLICLDMMVPATHLTGAMLLAVDVVTRYTVGEYVPDYTTKSTLLAFKKILLRLGGTPGSVLLDRQSAFTSKAFTDHLTQEGINYKLAPPHHHDIFNGIVERQIQTLRHMASSSLHFMALGSKFWKFSVYHSIYVKNRLPHTTLNDKVPYELFYKEKVDYKGFKVFGCLSYQLRPLQQRKDKFMPISQPKIFLGYDQNGSFNTCLLFDPDSQRMSYAHISDVFFNETTSYAAYKKTVMQPVNFSPDDRTIQKHQVYAYEDSGSDTSENEETDQNEQSVTNPNNNPTEEQHNDNESTDTEELTVTTRSGRVSVPTNRYTPEVHAIITTEEKTTHEHKARTPAQLEKLKLKILPSKLEQKPAVYKDIINHSDRQEYQKAVDKEITTLHERGVLQVVSRTKAAKMDIGTVVILVTKKRSGKFKGRLVYNGRNQKYKLCDYSSSPTLSTETLTLALSIAANNRYHVKTLDVTSAFLYASLPEDTTLFAEIPFGHPAYESRQHKVLQITKNLYGLKEAPKIWWTHLVRTITTKTTLKQCLFDECAFFAQDIILLAYVDDLLLLGEKQIIQEVTRQLSKTFKLTSSELDEAVDFLGCTISRKEDGTIQISQATYIDKIIRKYQPNVTNKHTPLPTTFRILQEEKSDKTDFPFRECLGSLGYLRMSRVDILQALHQLAKVAAAPTKNHVKCIIHLLGYLKKTATQPRKFYTGTDNTNNLVAFTDAEFASNPVDRYSVSRNVIYFRNNLVTARSSTQPIMAASAPEAELIEIFRTSKKLQTFVGLLHDFNITNVKTAILTDSSSSVNTVHKPVTSRYKHMSVFIHYIRNQIERNDLQCLWINRKENVADLMTKQNNRNEFEKLLKAALTPFKWIHRKV